MTAGLTGLPNAQSRAASTGRARPLPVTEQPTTKVPLREWTFEPPPLEPEATPTWATEPTTTPEPTTDARAHRAGTRAAPSTSEPLPLTEQPTTQVPLRDWTAARRRSRAVRGCHHADAARAACRRAAGGHRAAGAGRQPQARHGLRRCRRRTAAGIGPRCGVRVRHSQARHHRQLSSPATETSTTTTEEDDDVGGGHRDRAGAAAAAPRAAVTVRWRSRSTGVESGTTVTDPTNEFLTKDAQGEFIVVRLTVQNTSPDPGQFLGTFQKLKAAGQRVLHRRRGDVLRRRRVGGHPARRPGRGRRSPTTCRPAPCRRSVELHADPISPGVELPVGVAAAMRCYVPPQSGTPSQILTGSSNGQYATTAYRQSRRHRLRRSVADGTGLSQISRRYAAGVRISATESALNEPPQSRKSKSEFVE